MIYDVELSNGSGDHVSMIVEAETVDAAKKVALAYLKAMPKEERWYGLNGAEPDMVRATTLTRSNGVYKVMAFDHEQGGYCY